MPHLEQRQPYSEAHGFEGTQAEQNSVTGAAVTGAVVHGARGASGLFLTWNLSQIPITRQCLWPNNSPALKTLLASWAMGLSLLSAD